MGLLSIVRFLIQPTKSLSCTGKSSGRFGTPPRSRGPVRSNDLQTYTQKDPWSHKQSQIFSIYNGLNTFIRFVCMQNWNIQTLRPIERKIDDNVFSCSFLVCLFVLLKENTKFPFSHSSFISFCVLTKTKNILVWKKNKGKMMTKLDFCLVNEKSLSLSHYIHIYVCVFVYVYCMYSVVWYY